MHDDRAFFESRFQSINRMIDEALRASENGEMVSLEKMSDEAAKLCSQLQKADPEMARDMQPALAEMIARLDTLEMKLRDLKSSLQ